MQPDDMRAYLAKHCAAPADGSTEAVPALPPSAAALAQDDAAPDADIGSDASHLEESLFKTISESYFRQRIGLAILSFLMPLFLVFWGFPALQGSMSAYYHYGDPANIIYGGGGARRDVLVGVLCAVGCFLNLYKGYSKQEDIALNIAGVTAIGVALFPMDWPSACAPDDSFLACASPVWQVHAASAVIFFLMIAYVCVFR